MPVTPATAQLPANLQPHHYGEWLESAVDPAIISLNLESLDNDRVQPGFDAQPEINERLNRTTTRFGRTTRQALRGWWVSGVDPLNNYKTMVWGRFKPDTDTPIADRAKGKNVKYLSPAKQPSRATFLRVPDKIWRKVAQRYEIAINYHDPYYAEGFWSWVRRYNVPIILTEGEKKAGCLLSLGYAAIALPGITTGTRKVIQNELAEHAERKLIPELEIFATPGRKVYVCFDFETKEKTIRDIRRETNQLCQRFNDAEAEPHIISLPGPEKGVDDFVMAMGGEAFFILHEAAIGYAKWQRQLRRRFSFKPSIELNQDKLGPFVPLDPELRRNPPKLTVIKSAKGTGKTHWLAPEVEDAISRGQRVLLITHRVQLGQELSRRLGVDYVTEIYESETAGLLGFGICIDSMHAESQARFNPEYWKDALIILDEARQVIWHSLSASTEISNRRNEILKNLKVLLTLCMDEENDGRVILSDADMDDTTIRFVAGMAGFNSSAAIRLLNPFVIYNKWKPGEAEAWDISHYEDHKPTRWYKALCEELERGNKVYIATHSQKAKSNWGTKTLEEALTKRFPTKRVLRIDSTTITDPKHPAFGILQVNDAKDEGKLDRILSSYDVVLASPTMETGVSIDLRGHFSSVWGVFQGVSHPDSVRQSLARVRENVPRHIWVTKFSRSREGNGSTTVYGILQSIKNHARWTGQLLAVGLDPDSDEFINQCAFDTWARMAAEINLFKRSYRDSVIEGLQEEGHHLSIADDFVDDDEVMAEVSEASEALYEMEKAKIAIAEELTPAQAEKLDGKKERTEEEYFQLRKHKLQERYGLEVSPELIELDDDGFYPKVQLHFYLTTGKEFLAEREKSQVQRQIEKGETWFPSLFRNLFGMKVQFIERLRLLELLDPEKLWHKNTPLIERIAGTALANASAIKTVLGITVSPKMSNMQIVQALLSKLGTKLKCVRRSGSDGDRLYIYRWQGWQDPRFDIFEIWESRERERIAEMERQAAEAEAASQPETFAPEEFDYMADF